MLSLKACLWLFALLTLSGLLLMLSYVPSAAPSAPASPSAGVSLGYILRGVHFWAAQIAVILALTHLGGMVFVKMDRACLGSASALVLLTCLLCFTGYLLPWDQLAFWMQQLWLPNVTAQNALWAVYWTHTLALSLLMLPLLLVHVRRMRRSAARSV